MEYSRHALEQMARRRIGRRAVDFTLSHGEERHLAGATFYVLRRRDVPPNVLRTDAEARRCVGTTVIVSGNTIVTVYRNPDLRHFHRKYAGWHGVGPRRRRSRRRRPRRHRR